MTTDEELLLLPLPILALLLETCGAMWLLFWIWEGTCEFGAREEVEEEADGVERVAEGVVLRSLCGFDMPLLL